MPAAFRSSRINRTPIRRKFVSVHFCDSHSVVPIFFLFLHFYALLLKYASISRLKRNFKTNQLNLFNFDSSFFSHKRLCLNSVLRRVFRLRRGAILASNQNVAIFDDFCRRRLCSYLLYGRRRIRHKARKYRRFGGFKRNHLWLSHSTDRRIHSGTDTDIASTACLSP